MTDAERAEKMLDGDPGRTCAFCRGEECFFRCERGILPVLTLAEEGRDLSGYAAADRVVGRAAALLYCLLRVKSVTAPVMSEGAKTILKSAGISVTYRTLTPMIRNRRGDGICPMEDAVAGITDPNEAVTAIRTRAELLKAQH